MQTHPSDEQIISRTLADLRRRIRWYVAAEAVLCGLLFLGAVFWAGLLIDWMFEPSPNVRAAVHVVIGLVAAGILFWWGVRRWMVRLPDHSLALVLERRYPELAERLSTAVDLPARESSGEEVHPELAERTRRAAASATADLSIGAVLNQSRQNQLVVAAIGLTLSIVLLSLAAPKTWDTYVRRIALSPEQWPRTVQLSIEGFQPDGKGGWIRKVARNSDVPVVVNASLAGELTAPHRVTIRYQWQDGARGRDDLVRIGNATPGRDAQQRYEYLFERIAGSVEFRIRGGDDRLERLRIEVVERPKVTELLFACQYPEYLGRADRTITAGPRVEVPAGTRITIAGKANKPLDAIRWQNTVAGEDGPATEEATTSSFHGTTEVGRQDVELAISLLDQDGIESAEPFTVTIAAKQDQIPQVLVDRDGVGLAVTPMARLPLRIRLEDDYAVDAAWIDMRIGEQAVPQQPITLPPGPRSEVLTTTSIDLRELSKTNKEKGELVIEPGQRIALIVSASDRYDLSNEPRVGSARAMSLEIVTPEELIARLSGTEQNLRQTFEAIADKLLVLYDSLDGLETKPEPAAASRRETDLLVMDTEGEEALAVEVDSSSALAIQTGRLAEDARQIASEVLAVAAGFEDVHAQLANNRVDNSELAERIAVRIAAPLRRLGSERMPTVAERIAQIAGDDDALSGAKQETRLAVADAEQVLREMQGLENYNEVIATLREIIRQQERVHVKTKERQKDEVRNLLLD